MKCWRYFSPFLKQFLPVSFVWFCSPLVSALFSWLVPCIQGVASLPFITRAEINSCCGPDCEDTIWDQQNHILKQCEYFFKRHLKFIYLHVTFPQMLCCDSLIFPVKSKTTWKVSVLTEHTPHVSLRILLTGLVGVLLVLTAEAKVG